MNTYQNKEVKKYLWITLVFSVLAMLVIGGITYWQWQLVKEKENTMVLSLLLLVKEEYPKVEIENLISEINQEKENTTNREIMFSQLKKYGITDGSYLIAKMKQSEQNMLWGNVLLLAVIELILFLNFAHYLKKRQTQLNILTEYMQDISRGKYTLELSDNSEDELSNLKNELYKITISLKEQAKVAKEKKEMLADTVSDISHQLKTPLTSISILMDNLIESEDMPLKVQQKFLNEISHQIIFLNWMVSTLLKCSRLDAGVVEFEKDEVNISQLITEIFENLEMIAEVKNVSLHLCYLRGAKKACIIGDYNWNREAIQNIVKNAIEHSNTDSIVEVLVETNDVYTKITVINQGVTISKEDRRHIFERFYKAKNASQTSIGIGLSLAKSIVEQQNGYISLDSVDGETRFMIKYLK